MASPSAGIRVEGADRLRRTMRQAGQDLGQLREAHAAAAAIAGATGKLRAPKDSGTLAGNVRWSGTTTAAILRVGSARVPYANPIHWGWPARGIRANPFLSYAARSTEAQWTQVYEKAVERILSTIKGV